MFEELETRGRPSIMMAGVPSADASEFVEYPGAEEYAGTA